MDAFEESHDEYKKLISKNHSLKENWQFIEIISLKDVKIPLENEKKEFSEEIKNFKK